VDVKCLQSDEGDIERNKRGGAVTFHVVAFLCERRRGSKKQDNDGRRQTTGQNI